MVTVAIPVTHHTYHSTVGANPSAVIPWLYRTGSHFHAALILEVPIPIDIDQVWVITVPAYHDIQYQQVLGHTCSFNPSSANPIYKGPDFLHQCVCRCPSTLQCLLGHQQVQSWMKGYFVWMRHVLMSPPYKITLHSVHWQQGKFQLWAICFMSQSPVSNVGLRISKTPLAAHCCVLNHSAITHPSKHGLAPAEWYHTLNTIESRFRAGTILHWTAYTWHWRRYHFVWRRHENMSPNTGSRVNSNWVIWFTSRSPVLNMGLRIWKKYV